MSTIKTCLLSIFILLALSCKQETAEEKLKSVIDNIMSLNSGEYILNITNAGSSYSSTSAETFARNPKDTTLFDLITQDNDKKLHHKVINNGFLHTIAEMLSGLHEKRNDYIDLDTINIYLQNDTLAIISGVKANDIYVKHLLKIENNLPIYVGIFVKNPQSSIYEEAQSIKIAYKQINNVNPVQIEELKNQVKEQNFASLLNFSNKYLKGTINNIPVRMHLTNSESGGKNILGGSYYYTKKGTPIKLSGELSNDGSFTLSEIVDKKNTGTFTGQFSQSNEISGTWSNPNGDKIFPFRLIDGYEPLEIRWIEEKKTKNDATVDLKIPQIKNADYITQEINNKIAATLDGGNIENHLTLIDDMESGHFSETGSIVHTNDNGIFSLTISSFTYMGGAHPNTHIISLNFDTRDGEILKLDDLFIDGYEDTLNKLAIEKFKKTCDNKENEDPDWYSWEVENIPKYLKENFIIGISGISFFFNRYDIGPYAAGSPPDIFLTYNELEEIIDHSGVLSQMVD